MNNISIEKDAAVVAKVWAEFFFFWPLCHYDSDLSDKCTDLI